jgi:hypothetical protein
MGPVFQDLDNGSYHYGVEAAARAGLIVPVPEEVEVHHAQYGTHAVVALVPMRVGSSDGSVRALQPGDLLSADECHTAGTALASLVSRHMVARLPATTGVVGLARLAAR